MKSVIKNICFTTIIALSTHASHGALVINFFESGSNVIATVSGAINSMSGAQIDSTPFHTGENSVDGDYAQLRFSNNPGASERYISYNTGFINPYPESFGIGFGTPLVSATSSTVSTNMRFTQFDPKISYDFDYVLGTPVTGSMTWANSSFSSIGVAPGTYVWSWTADSVTVNVGAAPSPVPEPSQVAASLLVLAGIGGFVWLKRRKAIKSALATA